MINKPSIKIVPEPYRLILASQSPRRQQLLMEMGLEFEVWNNVEVDENVDSSVNPTLLPKLLAQRKAEAYAAQITTTDVVLTCDTVVLHQNQPLNKPVDMPEARKMLKRLSGNKHTVITGICIRTIDKQVINQDITDVWFETLSDEEIEYYLQYFKPLDKAGAYGIQEWIGLIGIRRIEGSYTNVVGLPTSLIYRELKQIAQNLKQT